MEREMHSSRSINKSQYIPAKALERKLYFIIASQYVRMLNSIFVFSILKLIIRSQVYMLDRCSRETNEGTWKGTQLKIRSMLQIFYTSEEQRINKIGLRITIWLKLRFVS